MATYFITNRKVQNGNLTNEPTPDGFVTIRRSPNLNDANPANFVDVPQADQLVQLLPADAKAAATPCAPSRR
jgi:hypothetical protein